MRSVIKFAGIALMLLSVSLFAQGQNSSLTGAWEHQDPGSSVIKIVTFEDHYFIQTTYDPENKQFIESVGGTYEQADDQLTVNVEFHTEDKSIAGQTATLPLQINGDEFTISVDNGTTETWHRIDHGQGALAGNWRITQRQQDGQMHAIPEGDRKTFKILSGTRFQWIAVNTATGDFFGTGGGTYTFKNGKYTENIEFFSRDSTRVGKSLSFDDEVKKGQWHHKGLSSKGDPIYEIWEKAE